MRELCCFLWLGGQCRHRGLLALLHLTLSALPSQTLSSGLLLHLSLYPPFQQTPPACPTRISVDCQSLGLPIPFSEVEVLAKCVHLLKVIISCFYTYPSPAIWCNSSCVKSLPNEACLGADLTCLNLHYGGAILLLNVEHRGTGRVEFLAGLRRTNLMDASFVVLLVFGVHVPVLGHPNGDFGIIFMLVNFVWKFAGWTG